MTGDDEPLKKLLSGIVNGRLNPFYSQRKPPNAHKIQYLDYRNSLDLAWNTPTPAYHKRITLSDGPENDEMSA